MATIVKERIINLVLFYNITGNRLSCTMHYGCDTALAADSPDKFQTAWQAAVLPAWLLAVGSPIQFDRIYTYAIEKDTCRPGNDQLFGQVGALGEDSLPENLAAVFQLRQNDVSSKNNGRLFVGGLTELQCVDGLITAAAIAAELKDLADALLLTVTDTDGRNYKLVALQKRAAGAAITPVGHTVASISVSRAMASQRRRRTELESFSA